MKIFRRDINLEIMPTERAFFYYLFWAMDGFKTKSKNI